MRIFLIFVFVLAAFGRAAGDSYPGAPASVVAGYLEADGAGLALAKMTAPQVLCHTTWKDPARGDGFPVIKSYDIGEVGWKSEGAKDGDTAYVQITYHVLGRLDGHEFTARPGTEEVFFDVVRRKGEWKIVSPRLAPHLFLAAAITAVEAVGAVGKPSLEKLRALE